MGCDLQTYRARIGTWTGRTGRKLHQESYHESPRLNHFYVLVISVLLVIGGIELNPGPVQEAVKCQTCKKNLRTGLLCSLCLNWYHFSCQKIKKTQQIEDSWKCIQCEKNHTTEVKEREETKKMLDEVQQLRAKLKQAEDKIQRLEEEIKRLKPQEEYTQKKPCLVLGDSIIKHVGKHREELSVECFPGIRTEQMKKAVEQQEQTNPETVIVHVGSNDLKRNTDHIIGDMYDLATTVKNKFPAAKIILSGVIRRRDVNWRKVGRLNDSFQWVAERLGLLFVDPNSWLGENDLGRDGVHLNRRGAATLASLFTRVAASFGDGRDEDSGDRAEDGGERYEDDGGRNEISDGRDGGCSEDEGN